MVHKIAFSMIRDLNSTSGHTLIERIGSEEEYFRLPEAELKMLSRLRNETLISDTYRQDLLKKAEKENLFVYSNNIRTLYFRDSIYPKRLLDPPDSPVMLYQLGDGTLDTKFSVGIVGTRHATPVGCKITETIVKEIADALGNDVNIISGLAYGIDVASHKAAMDAGLPTVAVLGHPLNTVYPADHRSVAVKIIKEGGALVSEYPTSSKKHPACFLARNRIIAGLSDVVIVVESDFKGGAMTTARLAADYNREVMAVPGRLTDTYSRGTNDLIATNRAVMYTGIESLLNLMNWQPQERIKNESKLVLALTEEQTSVLKFISENPDLTLNDIVRQTGIPYAHLSDILFQLEMGDYILSLPGGRYTLLN